VASVGIYGVMSYTVRSAHTNSVWRWAGAQTADVLRLVIEQGMKLALTGVAMAWRFVRVDAVDERCCSSASARLIH